MNPLDASSTTEVSEGWRGRSDASALPRQHPRHRVAPSNGTIITAATTTTTNGGGSVPRSVLLVGTYPPTECGLATYTANLREAVEWTGATSQVLRLLDDDDHSQADSRHVAGLWRRGSTAVSRSASRSAVHAAADVASRFDAILLQHEFGIFPGIDGCDVVPFVDACRPPLITVLHTVLERPSDSQRRIVDAVLACAHRVVVHSEVAYRRLLAVTDVNPERVAVIPHGATPNLVGPTVASGHSPDSLKRPIMLTWGLLGPGKGIEHGIEAVGKLRTSGLDVRYVVAGQTHPNVRAREGERYRLSLTELTRRCGVSDLVEFDDGYRDWDALRTLVRSATLVLVPYDSTDQVTSGVLVEALAAGKPVVATGFPHAVELSQTGAVAIVPHGSPDDCAAAVRDVLIRPELRLAMETAARAEGARYDWTNVGRQFRQLIEAALEVEQGRLVG
jgi:glycosyltransferase involved in cell wall biosynthesis